MLGDFVSCCTCVSTPRIETPSWPEGTVLAPIGAPFLVPPGNRRFPAQPLHPPRKGISGGLMPCKIESCPGTNIFSSDRFRGVEESVRADFRGPENRDTTFDDLRIHPVPDPLCIAPLGILPSEPTVRVLPHRLCRLTRDSRPPLSRRPDALVRPEDFPPSYLSFGSRRRSTSPHRWLTGRASLSSPRKFTDVRPPGVVPGGQSSASRSTRSMGSASSGSKSDRTPTNRGNRSA